MPAPRSVSSDKTSRKRLAILKALHRSERPLTSAALAEWLEADGIEASERTVRLYLKELADEGRIATGGRRGSVITEAGIAELRRSMPLQRIGLLSAKIDKMTYCMDFDLSTRAGQVVVNTSVVDPAALAEHIGQICEVFAKGFAMGRLVSLEPPGQRVGGTVIPPGRIGFCTVCSVTVNGVLLKHGVPMRNRFGGLLDIRDGTPSGFVELIDYDGTSIDPLEIFIRSSMTDYLGAIATGNGRIGASFREIPEDSRELVLALGEKLARVGMGALMQVGYGGRPLLDIPVSEGRAGAIVCGGLNPIAVLEESGHRVDSWALSGLMEYGRLFSYEELPERVKRFV